MSSSLTDSSRRSAWAASRSASAAGMTTVRRTPSSLSHAWSGVSDTLPPFRRNARRPLRRDITPQDAVAQQAQTAQVGEARSLGQSGHHRQMQRRAHPGNGQIGLDPPFELGPGQRAAQAVASLGAEQRLEPPGLEADRDHHEVIGDSLALALVLDRDDDLPLAGLHGYRPPGERAEPAR